MAKKKKRKPSAKKKPKLRGKPLADLPAKSKRAARVKGGGVTLSAQSLTVTQPSLPAPTFAPPYVPVRVLGPDITPQR